MEDKASKEFCTNHWKELPIPAEFNTSDKSKCAIDQGEVTGSAGWNVDKIEYIKSL